MSDRLLASRVPIARVASLVVLGLAIAGCGAGGGWAAALVVLLALGGLTLSGCTSSHTTNQDAGVRHHDSEIPELDAGGRWERCCVDGRVDSCFCESGWSCNYGWFTDCGDGLCSERGNTCPGDLDGGVVDAGGAFEPCCVDGRVESCFCPAGAECNYGWYTDCGDGTCAASDTMCPSEGTWEPCCVDGTITTCFCPSGAACNYGWYTDCGDGICVDPGATCPAP